MRGRRHEEMTSRQSTSTSSARPKAAGGTYASKQPAKLAMPSKNGKMEMYDHFYHNFERPPMAPVYYPTEEEFTDPIEYVAKIRPEAEKYGVVKIVPPENFKPPFAIDKDSFYFSPRTQKLNEVEAIVKEKHTFVDRLVNFNRYKGIAYDFPKYKNGTLVDLHRLHRIVQNFGGCEEVNDEEKWRDVAREILPPDQMTRGVPSSFINLIRSHYNIYIEPFNRSLREKESKKDDESDDELEELKHKYQHHHGTMRSDVETEDKSDIEWTEEDCPVSMQSGRRRSKTKKSGTTSKRVSDTSTSSKTNGTSSKSTKNNKKVKKEEEEEDEASDGEEAEEEPITALFCIVCQVDKDVDELISCDIEKCHVGIHPYCADEDIESGEWRCPQCIEAEDAKIGLDWGFYDAETEYNLNTFKDFADDFKKKHFGTDHISKITCEQVEKDFWRYIVSPQNLAVKYGADLITSRVGSGFPRKEDRHYGPDAKLKQQYSHHAWNLNNMPVLRESVLSHFNMGISGMMVPWVYVGMCFSTFCWHTEDHWTYSVNYNHFGERKIWYGIGGDDAEKFEDALRKIAPGLTGRQRDLFHHMTTAANPALLRSMGVPIYSVHQNAGEFVITFPRAYHAGFNEGYNFAEAVNFAPIDWLAKGRECIESYSSVRRYLVFSHDELIFKMVEAMDKLGLSMSLACQDELKIITQKQKKRRQTISRLGISKKEQVDFETIPDEQRSCRFCKTTLFMSGITCKCEKMSCVEHYEHLCKKCSQKDCKYQYRHEISHLEKMCNELSKRTVDYSGWKEESEEILETKEKPGLEKIEQCIDKARLAKYPQTDYLHKLLTIKQMARSAIEKANQLMYKKVRTRTKTRCQRADTRIGADGVRLLIEQMRAMDCDMTIISAQLEKWLESVEEWRAKSRGFIAQEASHSAEDLEAVIEEGDEFDIKISEIDDLKKAIQRKEWIEKAKEVTQWTPTDDMEKDIEYEFFDRWNSSDILTMIRDASRFSNETTSALTAKLQIMLRDAHMIESEAAAWVKKPSIALLNSTWQKARESDWFTDTNIDALRLDFVKHVRFKECFDLRHPNLVDLDLQKQLQQLQDSEFYYSEITQTLYDCKHSVSLDNSAEHKIIMELKEKMDVFTEKIKRLFKPTESFYSLFNILTERDDLEDLSRGDIPILKAHEATGTHNEWYNTNWRGTLEDMMECQNELREKQPRFMERLRETNTKRGTEGCVCLGRAKVDSLEPIISCIICAGQFHVRCCEWNQFFNRLPSGCFLCVRCLRGRRPVIDDVTAALNGVPTGSIESQMVRVLIQKARSITQKLMDGANKRNAGDPRGDQICKEALVDWLSCEILNLNGLPKAVELIKVFYADYLEKNLSASMSLQALPVSSKPRRVLFCPSFALASSSSKRKRNGTSAWETGGSKKSKKRQASEDDDDDGKTCASQGCQEPDEEMVDWVQCHVCRNWHHIICVNLTTTEVHRMNVFRCNNCLHHGYSPSSGASFH